MIQRKTKQEYRTKKRRRQTHERATERIRTTKETMWNLYTARQSLPVDSVSQTSRPARAGRLFQFSQSSGLMVSSPSFFWLKCLNSTIMAAQMSNNLRCVVFIKSGNCTKKLSEVVNISRRKSSIVSPIFFVTAQPVSSPSGVIIWNVTSFEHSQ